MNFLEKEFMEKCFERSLIEMWNELGYPCYASSKCVQGKAWKFGKTSSRSQINWLSISFARLSKIVVTRTTS